MRHLEKAGKQGMVLSEEMTENYWGKLRADPYFDADVMKSAYMDLWQNSPSASDKSL